MKMSEYTKAEWKKMKDKPFRERLSYFWEYFKLPTIAVALVIIAVIYTATAWMSRKDAVVSGILINSATPVEAPAFVQEFGEKIGIDAKKQEIALITGLSTESVDPTMSMITYQRVHAGIAAEETDFIISDEEAFLQFAYDDSEMLLDLRQFLTAEQLNQLEGRIYYADAALYDLVYESLETTVTYPSPYEPEKMEQPIPVGINIRDCKEFLDAYYYTDEPTFIGVVCNTPHPENTLKFVEFIVEHINEE